MKSICTSSSNSNLHSVEILAILLANSCIERKGPDNSSVHFMVSADFSSHTKHESNATVCGVVKSLKTPLNIISVTNSSSAELSSQATRPLNSITSAAVQYSMRRKTRLRIGNNPPWCIPIPRRSNGSTFSTCGNCLSSSDRTSKALLKTSSTSFFSSAVCYYTCFYTFYGSAQITLSRRLTTSAGNSILIAVFMAKEFASLLFYWITFLPLLECLHYRWIRFSSGTSLNSFITTHEPKDFNDTIFYKIDFEMPNFEENSLVRGTYLTCENTRQVRINKSNRYNLI
uniref:Uncharacterized protein n=1 Tax=Glossina pallidipes TaxID=7398 RepID=A0A1A9ZTH4_GLOPL